jgi:membrane-associated phospholipid phosphatase
VGFSRIYLSQHFLIDVMAGAMLGLICGYFAIALISSWKWNKLEATIQDIVKGNA